MKKICFWLIIAILLIAFQKIVINRLAIYQAAPDLILIATVYCALRYGVGLGESFGFIGGIFQDVFSVYLFGTSALVKTIIGFITGHLKRKLDFSNKITLMIIIFCASLLNYLICYLVGVIFLSCKVPFNGLTFLVFILYNTIITPIVFLVLNKVESLFLKDTTNFEGKPYILS